MYSSNKQRDDSVSSQTGYKPAPTMLVLEFDEGGRGKYRELSRIDVLRIVREMTGGEEAASTRRPIVPDVAKSPSQDGDNGSSSSDESETVLSAETADTFEERRPRRASPRALGWNTAGRRRSSSSRGSPTSGLNRSKKRSRTMSTTSLVPPKVTPRDLRRLDGAFTVSNEPGILVRDQTVLINADPIRAVVVRKRCFIFVPDGADSILSLLQKNFALMEDEADFEFRAYEAILNTLCKVLSDILENLEPDAHRILHLLERSTLSTKELEPLRNLKDNVNEFESQVNGISRALMEILDNDEDMLLMFLTRIHNDPMVLASSPEVENEKMELLLESYVQEVHSIRTRAELLRSSIENTESLVTLQLDHARNYLLTFDMIFSLFSFLASAGMLLTGIFGMNLHSGLEENEISFYLVSAGVLLLCTVLGILSLYFFKRRGLLIL